MEQSFIAIKSIKQLWSGEVINNYKD